MRWVSRESLAEELGVTKDTLRGWQDRHWTKGVHYKGEPHQFNVSAISNWFDSIAKHGRDRANGETPTELYRHFDSNGCLLYVGISLSTLKRTYEHKKSPWWLQVASISIERFSSRKEALAAEREAIRLEKPRHNKAHASEH